MNNLVQYVPIVVGIIVFVFFAFILGYRIIIKHDSITIGRKPNSTEAEIRKRLLKNRLDKEYEGIYNIRHKATRSQQMAHVETFLLGVFAKFRNHYVHCLKEVNERSGLPVDNLYLNDGTVYYEVILKLNTEVNIKHLIKELLKGAGVNVGIAIPNPKKEEVLFNEFVHRKCHVIMEQSYLFMEMNWNRLLIDRDTFKEYFTKDKVFMDDILERWREMLIAVYNIHEENEYTVKLFENRIETLLGDI